jgi:hypothetical protein
MADLNVQRVDDDRPDVFGDDEPTNFEIVLYVLGILAIPLVPILFVTFFTPFSGISQ